ncbi:hypothetical protein [Xanthomonas euvesicatoria]|uniref:hypothetical protein n=1 Tax=Xanthomonas euvesicatoria TaxID=456327 RepID=UPI003A0FF668
MKESMPASEFLAKLANDKSYQEQQLKKREELAMRQAEIAKQEAPLVAELKFAGFQVDSVWDLVGAKYSYEEAIPVLLSALKGDYPSKIKEGVLRGLAVRHARKYWADLIKIFEQQPSGGPDELKFVSACALAEAADDTVIVDVIEILKKREYGIDRAPLLEVLERSKDPRAATLLHELRDDLILGKEIKKFRRLKRKTSK